MTVSTDSFTDIVRGVVPSVPCAAERVFNNTDQKCPAQAVWLLFWRDPCGGGKKIEGGKADALCDNHKRMLLAAVSHGSIYCLACGDRLKGKPMHIIKSIEPL